MLQSPFEYFRLLRNSHYHFHLTTIYFTALFSYYYYCYIYYPVPLLLLPVYIGYTSNVAVAYIPPNVFLFVCSRSVQKLSSKNSVQHIIDLRDDFIKALPRLLYYQRPSLPWYSVVKPYQVHLVEFCHVGPQVIPDLRSVALHLDPPFKSLAKSLQSFLQAAGIVWGFSGSLPSTDNVSQKRCLQVFG